MNLEVVIVIVIVFSLIILLAGYSSRKVKKSELFLKQTNLVGLSLKEIEKRVGHSFNKVPVDGNNINCVWSLGRNYRTKEEYVFLELVFNAQGICILVVQNAYSGDINISSKSSTNVLQSINGPKYTPKTILFTLLAFAFLGTMIYITYDDDKEREIAKLIEDKIRDNSDDIIEAYGYYGASYLGSECEVVETDDYDRYLVFCDYNYELDNEVLRYSSYAIYINSGTFSGEYAFLFTDDESDAKDMSCFDEDSDSIECR